jgi:hypothetical protein
MHYCFKKLIRRHHKSLHDQRNQYVKVTDDKVGEHEMVYFLCLVRNDN